MQRLELGTVDARFSVRGAQDPDSRLVLVAVDDKTSRAPGSERHRDYSRGQTTPACWIGFERTAPP